MRIQPCWIHDSQAGPVQGSMARHVDYSSCTEHERRIADILTQQKRAEGSFLRDQAVTAGMCDGERCASEQTRFADLRADNQPDACSPCSFDNLQGPQKSTHFLTPAG